jgi:hypothetical protein
MPDRLLTAPGIPLGYVIVVEDGVLVADGLLADLQRVDGTQAEQTDIYQPRRRRGREGTVVRVRVGEGEAELIKLLRSLLSWWRTPDDRAVIDQAAYYDAVEAEERRKALLDRAIEKELWRISVAVSVWARDTVNKRSRAEISRIKHGIPDWLRGLVSNEVINLSKASAFDIKHHLFGDERIAGVRAVQPLPESVLVFPRPMAAPDDLRDRASSGGPRIKRVSSSSDGGGGFGARRR